MSNTLKSNCDRCKGMDPNCTYKPEPEQMLSIRELGDVIPLDAIHTSEEWNSDELYEKTMSHLNWRSCPCCQRAKVLMDKVIHHYKVVKTGKLGRQDMEKAFEAGRKEEREKTLENFNRKFDNTWKWGKENHQTIEFTFNNVRNFLSE